MSIFDGYYIYVSSRQLDEWLEFAREVLADREPNLRWIGGIGPQHFRLPLDLHSDGLMIGCFIDLDFLHYCPRGSFEHVSKTARYASRHRRVICLEAAWRLFSAPKI